MNSRFTAFSRLKAVLAQAPVCTPEKSPLTEPEVAERVRQIEGSFWLTRRGILSLDKYHTLVDVTGGIAMLMAVVGALSCSLFFFDAVAAFMGEYGFRSSTGASLVTLALACAAPALLMSTLTSYVLAVTRLSNEHEGYAPLQTKYCARLHDACQATAEGQSYRAQVLALGREFYAFELPMMEDWAASEAERVGCRMLYGVEDLT